MPAYARGLMTDAASAPPWLPAYLDGERAALARAVTEVENDGAFAGAVLAAARQAPARALVVGITGAPGAGKSTLVGAYVGELRGRGLSVAVLAVDPSSPLTGGALLGDRIRMSRHAGDAGVFVRSLASRGHLGGLARNAALVADVMAASGRDIVIVETVGVGQSEIEIAGLADVRVVVWAPGAGDDVQAAKAGILEIADLIVVNKADLPQAAATQAALRSAASYAAAPLAVMATAAVSGRGVPELADAIAALADAQGAQSGDRARERRRRRLVGQALTLAQEAVAALDAGTLDALLDRVDAGEIDSDRAARRLLAAALARD